MVVFIDLVEEMDFKNTIHSKIYQKKDILQKISERSRITYKIRYNIYKRNIVIIIKLFNFIIYLMINK